MTSMVHTKDQNITPVPTPVIECTINFEQVLWSSALLDIHSLSRQLWKTIHDAYKALSHCNYQQEQVILQRVLY